MTAIVDLKKYTPKLKQTNKKQKEEEKHPQ